MRGREFLMKDAYSFDLDHAGAVLSYRRMMLAYMRTFQRLGVQAMPMAADTGPIGGDLSHEFHHPGTHRREPGVLRRRGRDRRIGSDDVDHTDPADLDRFFEAVTTPYAATDEKHDLAAWARCRRDAGGKAAASRSARSSTSARSTANSMGLSVAGPDGEPVHPNMGSYGIGVSRLVGALIEAHHDEAGIIWPDERGAVPRGHPEPQAGRRRDGRSARTLYAGSAATRCTTTGTSGPGRSSPTPT